MFDIDQFYSAAIEGKPFNLQEVVTYLKSCKNLVLWGAGNCGTQIGEKLTSLGIEITCFWDRRAAEICDINGIKVLPTFTGGFLPEETLVITCITNGSLGDDTWQIRELVQNEYINYLQGIRLYEALVCPFRKGDKLIHEVCLNNSICSMCNCKRYMDMIPRRQYNDGREIIIQVVTVILTRACTLSCKNCGQRTSDYPKEVRSVFPDINSMKHDYDNFMKNEDAVGMVSIIGGEPFLHPDIVEFAQHCLKYEHFGALNITTNGVCKITEDMLTKLKNPRLKITFSDYTQFLTEKQKELFNRNIDKVKSAGINMGIGVPIWSMPGDIERFDYSEDYMTTRKASCRSIELCSTIVDGHFVPCTLAEVTRGLKILDFPEDYVDLSSDENLRDRIYNCFNKEYYETCRYCTNIDGKLIPAGEQRC